jgi:hypothetical protein
LRAHQRSSFFRVVGSTVCGIWRGRPVSWGKMADGAHSSGTKRNVASRTGLETLSERERGVFTNCASAVR